MDINKQQEKIAELSLEYMARQLLAAAENLREQYPNHMFAFRYADSSYCDRYIEAKKGWAEAKSEEEKTRNEQVNKMKGFTNDEDIVEVIVLDSSLNDENKSCDENQKDTFNCFICGITKRNSKKFTFICGHSACTLCVKKWKITRIY